MDVSVVFDLMIHDLDLLAKISQSDVKQLTAEAKTMHGTHADYVATNIQFENGIKASLIASRLEETPIRDMRLVYADGEVHIDFLNRYVTNSTQIPLAFDFDDEIPPPAFRDPLGFGTQKFIFAILRGRVSGVTGQEGRAALDLALRIESAAMNMKETVS